MKMNTEHSSEISVNERARRHIPKDTFLSPELPLSEPQILHVPIIIHVDPLTPYMYAQVCSTAAALRNKELLHQAIFFIESVSIV
jgi:hypothetical protein